MWLVYVAAARSSADDYCTTSRHWWTTTADSAATDAGSECGDQHSTAPADAADTAAEQHPAGLVVAKPSGFPGNGSITAATDPRSLHVPS